MQRAALRLSAAGLVQDVPLGAFTDGQLMQYDAASNTLRGISAAAALDRQTGWNAGTQVCAVTALADMVGHTFALGIGTYYFMCRGAYRSNATTTGLRLTANYSGSSSSYNGALMVVTGAAGACEYLAQTVLNNALGSGTGPGAVDVPFEFWGRIVTTSAGTFAMRIASEVAVASGITLAVGAQTEVWKA